MKEVEQIQKDKLEVVAEKPVLKQEKFLGRITQHRGHKLFEFNLKTKLITLARFEKVEIDFKAAQAGKVGTKRKVIVQPDCIYASALNIKNAKKHFIKMMLKK